MVGEDKYMDKTCVWLESLIGWADRFKGSPIHFAGTGSTFGNRPAQFIELIFMKEGCVSDLTMGPMRTSIGEGQFGLLNVHFGNVAQQAERFLGWCVFLDVSGERRFDVLKEAPLALVANVRDRGRVDRAFGHVVERCRATAWTPERYSSAARIADRHVGVAGQALLKAALLELLGTLLEEVTEGQGGGPSIAMPAGLGRAVALVQRRYQEPGLGRLEMAEAAGLHADHFGRMFLKHMGVSPVRYLTQTRVSQACFLLEHTGQKVEQIAREVGFEDPLHFSRVFKGVVGVSPRGWRGRK
jgi:AraC-like DNA-binding protein